MGKYLLNVPDSIKYIAKYIAKYACEPRSYRRSQEL